MKGLQCPRLLWFKVNNPEAIPDYDEATKARFKQGRQIGEVAQELFPEGELVSFGDFNKTIEDTEELVEDRVTVFEASFKADDLYCRVDILEKVDGGWNLIEVKSSTRVKDQYIEDVAFQKYCLDKAGVDIQDCYVMHINNQYVRSGEVEPRKLFEKESVTEEVENKQEEVENNLDNMRRVIKIPDAPNVPVGPHRTTPYDCPLEEKCCSSMPEHDVTELFYIGDDAWDLADDGIFKIKDIPEDYRLSPNQQTQYEAVVNEEPQIDQDKIKEFLEGFEEPIYFLDFEAFMTAIPLFDGVRPYQTIPFQFSLHKLEDGEVEHYEYLYKGEGDPRPELAEELQVIGERGSIVAFNTRFEKRMLDQLSQASRYSFDSLKSRFVDLATPFKNFWYYDPEQHGSYSLKNVLPCIVGSDYDGLEIDDGDLAQREFVRVNYNDASDEERVREQLLKYCEQDTYSLIEIMQELKRIVS